MARKKTNEEFVEEVRQTVGDEYIFLEYYSGAKTKIKCRHNMCGHEYCVSPSNFLSNGNRCPKCTIENIKNKTRKTNEEFIKEVFDLVDNTYIFLEEYVNNSTKIKCRHNECGHEYYVRPSNFLKGQRCPKCDKYGYNRDTAQYKNEVYQLEENNYEVLGEYIDVKTKVKMRHTECETIFYMRPNNFLNGSRCPKCRRPNYNRNDEQFKQEICNLVENEYTFLEEYKGSQVKIKCKHNQCGHIWKVAPNNFLNNNTRCPNCFGGVSKSQEQFERDVYELVGSEYVFLKEYINDATKIPCRHNECGHEWEVIPSNFLRGTRCPKCFGTHLKTQKQFEREVYNLVGDEYTVVGKYINRNTKIKIRHNECSHEYYVLPNNFFGGTRCPICLLSKGEYRILDFLNKHNQKCIPQYAFDDCRNINPLPFDFYLPDSNLLIEYDGKQHFEPVDFAGKGEEWAIERFKYIQINDNIKNQYCKQNNIPLLRIPYLEFENIEEILFKKLTELKVSVA